MIKHGNGWEFNRISAGLYTVYTSGILGSFSALYDLAVDYGGWNNGVGFLRLGILLPLCIDVYWLTALGVAIDSSRGNRDRIWAAVHALAAIALSVTGNLLYHELHAGDMRLDHVTSALLVAVIGSVPVLAAGALTHLAILARAPAGTVEKTGERPAGRKQAKAEGTGRKQVRVPQPEDTRPASRKAEDAPPEAEPEAAPAPENSSTEEPDIDTSTRALAIYLGNPEISGAELSRKLGGMTERNGRYILQGLKDQTSGERRD